MITLASVLYIYIAESESSEQPRDFSSAADV
jgi:hypothetical protein